MARSARELFEEAMRLDPAERATLMRLLIDTLDAESEEGAEDAWRAEVERRIAELDSGAVEAVPLVVKGVVVHCRRLRQSSHIGSVNASRANSASAFGLFLAMHSRRESITCSRFSIRCASSMSHSHFFEKPNAPHSNISALIRSNSSPFVPAANVSQRSEYQRFSCSGES